MDVQKQIICRLRRLVPRILASRHNGAISTYGRKTGAETVMIESAPWGVLQGIEDHLLRLHSCLPLLEKGRRPNGTQGCREKGATFLNCRMGMDCLQCMDHIPPFFGDGLCLPLWVR